MTPSPASPLVAYKSWAAFDDNTLPRALRRQHRTKVGIWGVIRVLAGRVRYCILDPVSETILDWYRPDLVLAEQPHFVNPLGAIRMQVEFHDRIPDL